MSQLRESAPASSGGRPLRAASRLVVNWLVPALTGLCALIAVALLGLILYALLANGGRALSWQFLTTDTTGGGSSGGVLYQVLGTCLLIGTAWLVAAPIATALALWRAVYLQAQPRAARAMDILLQVLNGVPSIVYGILGLLFFIKFLGWGKSWLSGGILLGLIILPTLAVALAERLAAVPREYIEAAAGLGLTREQMVRRIWLPQSWPGLVTGTLLGLARAAGETAPILFVAAVFSGATWPTGVQENPVLALPYHIFVLAQDTYNEEARANLWGSALVLVGMVMLLNLAALPLRLNLHEEADHA